ncbi:MAG: pilus assembly protein [Pseudomonadota bacterium]
MLNAIKTFKNDESGAVTVDWVVLTAALVGLGLAVMAVVSQGIGNVTAQINNTLQTDHLATSAAGFNIGLGN